MQAAEAWKKATEEERAPHVAAAEQEKEVYEKASVEYGVKKEAATVAAAAAEAEGQAVQCVSGGNSYHRLVCSAAADMMTPSEAAESGREI